MPGTFEDGWIEIARRVRGAVGSEAGPLWVEVRALAGHLPESVNRRRSARSTVRGDLGVELLLVALYERGWLPDAFTGFQAGDPGLHLRVTVGGEGREDLHLSVWLVRKVVGYQVEVGPGAPVGDARRDLRLVQ